MVLNNTLPNVGLSDKKMADVRKLRLRLLFGPEIAVGPGKVALLQAIRETGSISAAARRMNMSYRRAWLLVDTMNRCFRKPLVDASPGGKGGGGAKVTEFGATVLAKYQTMEKTATAAVSTHMKSFAQLLADHPPDAN